MTSSADRGPRRRGRPRDDAHEVAALGAATALLQESGVSGCTVEAVSRRSGVSKPAIYRRWPQRTALAIEAFAAHIDRQVPLAETGDAAHDLVQAVVRLAEQYQGHDGTVFAELIAAAVLEPGAAEVLTERFFAPRRAALLDLWGRGVSRGQLDPTADAQDMIDLLFGPATFRLLLGHQPVDPAAAESLARAALRGVVRAEPDPEPPS